MAPPAGAHFGLWGSGRDFSAIVVMSAPDGDGGRRDAGSVSPPPLPATAAAKKRPMVTEYAVQLYVLLKKSWWLAVSRVERTSRATKRPVLLSHAAAVARDPSVW